MQCWTPYNLKCYSIQIQFFGEVISAGYSGFLSGLPVNKSKFQPQVTNKVYFHSREDLPSLGVTLRASKGTKWLMKCNVNKTSSISRRNDCLPKLQELRSSGARINLHYITNIGGKAAILQPIINRL